VLLGLARPQGCSPAPRRVDALLLRQHQGGGGPGLLCLRDHRVADGSVEHLWRQPACICVSAERDERRGPARPRRPRVHGLRHCHGRQVQAGGRKRGARRCQGHRPGRSGADDRPGTRSHAACAGAHPCLREDETPALRRLFERRRNAEGDTRLDPAGLTTTYGSAVFAEHVPSTTAESVHLAESGGYTNVGKTNLHEFAYGVTSENPHFGTVPNPVAPGRIAGGSSGGSAAALAAGLADAALGTDSGGSIRIPAACCGVVGFKPTYGLVSIDGCFPLAPSFDHLGPMARTVEECAALLEVIAPGFAAAELTSLEEIAAGTAWVDEADPLVSRRVRESVAHFPRTQSIA